MRAFAPFDKTGAESTPEQIMRTSVERFGRPRAEVEERINRFLEGWHWYFKQVWTGASYFRSFDEYVRRRLRMAITGRVRLGWWNVRISPAVLRQLGLQSLMELNAGYRQDPWRAPARKG